MLNPVVIVLFIVCSVVIMECGVLNPCYCTCVGFSKLFVMGCKISISSILAISDSSAMSAYDALFVGLLGLGMGMILSIFQIWGI